MLDTPYFGAINTQNRLRILDAYWEGVARVLPEAFVDPTDFALQKSTGVQIMHALLISVLELLRSKGLSVVEPESYETVMANTLLTLEGDTGEGGVARGSDFWRVGVQGAAGSFSSNAGRRVLLSGCGRSCQTLKSSSWQERERGRRRSRSQSSSAARRPKSRSRRPGRRRLGATVTVSLSATST